MNFLNKLFVAVRESSRGQTMSEYVLILAAVSVTTMTAYSLLGGNVHTELSVITAAY